MFSSKNLTVIFLLAALLIFSFLVWPEYKKIQPLTLQIKYIESDIKNQETYFSELKNVSSKIEKDYKNKISLIEYAFPKDPNLPLLYDFMIKTCSRNGLILTSLSNSVSEPSESKKQGSIALSFGVSGSYASFKNLVSSLEKSARIFNIDSISFSSPAETNKPFDFSLNIKTQFIK